MEVKSVSGPGGKSIQDQEAEFEAQRQAEAEAEAQKQAEAQAKAEAEKKQNETAEIDESKVLDFLKTKLGREISSLDELNQERVVEKQVEIPEDVKSFLDYKNETGRGIDDFIKLNRDFKSMNEIDLVREYIINNDPEITEDELEAEMEDYLIDEDELEGAELAKAKRRLRLKAKEALDFFESDKEKYMKPLESKGSNFSQEELEEIKTFKEQIKNAKSARERDEKRSKWFTDKTSELFGEGFEGFKYKVDGKEFSWMPGDKDEIMKKQLSPANFVGKFLNEEGMIEDAEGYHKSLAAAMDPEAFAAHFIKIGQALARGEDEKAFKNISIDLDKSKLVRQSSDGFSVKKVESSGDYSGKLRMKS